MSTGIKPQEFATAGNYGAGSDDWSGQPRKVTMSASEKAQGFAPNTPVTAERRNGLHAEHFQGSYVQACSAMNAWDVQTLPATAGGRSVLFNFLVPVSNPSRSQKFVIALGHDVNDGNDLMFMRSMGAGFFEDTVNDAGPTDGPVCAAAGANGEWLTSVTGGAAIVSHTGLGQTKTTEVLAISGQPGALHYARYCAKYLCTTISGNMYQGATLAGLTLATDPSVTAFVTPGLGTAGGEFADDNSANIVYAGKCTIGGVNVFRILHSADGGLTWTVALTLGAGVTGLNVVWDGFGGTFIALDSDGKIYTSASGSSFSLIRTTTITASNGASVRHGTLAIQGYCLAKAYEPDLYGYKSSGIVYSFDSGATWRAVALSDSDAFGFEFGIRSLIGANGRFYATDETRVFRSGCVMAEAHDYT